MSGAEDFILGLLAGVVGTLAGIGILIVIVEFRDWKKRVNKLLEATEEKVEA